MPAFNNFSMCGPSPDPNLAESPRFPRIGGHNEVKERQVSSALEANSPIKILKINSSASQDLTQQRKSKEGAALQVNCDDELDDVKFGSVLLTERQDQETDFGVEERVVHPVEPSSNSKPLAFSARHI